MTLMVALGLLLTACAASAVTPSPTASSTSMPDTPAMVKTAVQAASLPPTSKPDIEATFEYRLQSTKSAIPTYPHTRTAIPGPTPNMVATIEAVVAKRIAEAVLVGTRDFTVGATLTLPDVQTLVLVAILGCLTKETLYDTQKATVDAKYRGNGEWLAEVSVGSASSGPISGRTVTLGQWRVMELTGELIPYDSRARSSQWRECIN